MTTCRNSGYIDTLKNDIDTLWDLYNGAEARLKGTNTKAREEGETTKEGMLIDLMRKARPHIGNEYNRDWPEDDAFEQMLHQYDTAISHREEPRR